MTKKEEAALAKEMSDQELVDAWNKVADPERLTVFSQAVLDEMQRRGVDF